MTETGSQKSADAYRTISEVAAELKLPQHVLRFWETRFSQLKPLKRAGGRRFYRPEDIHLLRAVKTLLYGDGYTIKGVQRILREQGPRAVAALAASPERGPALRPSSQPLDPEPDPEPQIEIAPAAASAVPPRLEPAGESLAPARADPPGPGDAAARLRAVLRELDDCARLLAAARPARR